MASADDYVQGPADQSGKAWATREVDQAGAPNSAKAHLQKIQLTDQDGVALSVVSNRLAVDSRAVADSTYTGTMDALDETVEIVVPAGAATVMWFFTGTINNASVITFERSGDGGTTWVPAPVIGDGLTAFPALTILGSGPNFGLRAYWMPVAAGDRVRCQLTTFNSGDVVTVNARASQATPAHIVMAPKVQGDALHDVANSSNTLQIGGEARDIGTPPTGVGAVGRRVKAWFTKRGAQVVQPHDGRIVTYTGRVSTFRQLGRAGTAGQKILSIHNATASSVLVDVTKLSVDKWETVVKAVTVAPPIVRLWKFTALPTNGNTLTKIPLDSSQSSSASVTVVGDSSADGTNSGTTLTVTLPAGTILQQEAASRLITAAGYEPTDKLDFEPTGNAKKLVTLRALEGLVVFLDYTLATQNPVTDMWLASLEWEEYTLA